MSQITTIIPEHKWRAIQIKETGDLLIPITQNDRIKFRASNEIHFIRKVVAEKLTEASLYLPEGFCLVILDGYRTLVEQKRLWDEKIQRLTKDNPTWSLEKIESKVQTVVARPNPLANHHCGGAVDITLADIKGALLDMGPRLSGSSKSSEYGAFKMFPNILLKRVITKEQESNRKILRDVMEKAGFVWYPGEWWHYCWGDRMWAVYTGQKECVYGPIEL